MNMKIRTLALLALFFAGITYAQDSPPKAATQSEKAPSYISMKVGSLGAGLEFSHSIASRWAMRYNFTYFQYTKNAETKSGNVETVREAFVRCGGLGVIADYNLSKTNPNWKLAMGLVYQFNRVSDSRTYTYTGSSTPEDLGNLTLAFTAFPVNPYLGIVAGNFRSKKHLQFSFEAGTLFHGRPRVEFTGSGRIQQTTEQIGIVEENVKNYNWFPVGFFNLRYVIF